MTSLLEKTISVIAPHHCFLCSKESNILCGSCAEEVFGEGPAVCFLCNKPTVDSSVCPGCQGKTLLQHVWTAAAYEDVIKRILKAFKFDRMRAAYKPLALGMVGALPYLTEVLVVHVPTAPERVRLRGYDQAKLLAREVAKQQGWKHATLLRRRHNFRQVGAGRLVRQKQAQEAFELAGGRDLSGAHILLVDDVTTSGATLVAAAAVLSAAGAARIDAVVAAKHTLE